MTFVAARCPMCGGELQLDNQVESGFCMHCGSKIIVQDAVRLVRVDNSHLIETWMKMADAAREASNLREAYDYYTKIVENDPSNWKAVFYKGLVAAYQSSYKNTRFGELTNAIRNSLELASNMPIEKLVEIKKMMAVELMRVDTSYYKIAIDVLMGIIRTEFDGFTEYGVTDMRDAINELITGYQLSEINLTLLNGIEDEEGKGMRHNCLQFIAIKCRDIANVYPYIFSPGHEWLSCLPLHLKRKFIVRYDEVVYEARLTEPQVEQDELIDRIDPIQDVFTPKFIKGIIGDKRKAENLRLRNEANEKIAIEKQQQYWREHPEEYAAHLAEERKKVEEQNAREMAKEKQKQEQVKEQKDNLQKEINERNLKLEQLKRDTTHQVDQLQREREGLGFLAISKKKEIDQKIVSLEKQLSDLIATIEVLSEQLKNLKP